MRLVDSLMQTLFVCSFTDHANMLHSLIIKLDVKWKSVHNFDCLFTSGLNENGDASVRNLMMSQFVDLNDFLY